MVKGLLIQHIKSPIGTLKRKSGIKAITASICIGIGIKAIKSPSKTARETIFLLVERYSWGILYFFIKPLRRSLFEVFFNVFRIIHTDSCSK